ncbi:AMP-binding enzyme domain-containing protein [Sarocladium implicatum]|nr:AMP-binding enzyme domain-containing protein [Sarocladium implicatum]
MAAARIYQSPYPTPHYPTNLSVSQFLLQSDPDDVPADQVIFADFDNPSRCLTYRQLRDDAAKDAAVLRSSFGIREGDVVCIYAQNSLEWVKLAHAVVWAGACFCGINPLASKYELEHYFKVAEPKIVATDGPLMDNVKHALEALKIKPSVLVLEHDSLFSPHGQPIYTRDFKHHDIQAISPLDLSGRDNRRVPAAMCFSSGTSGNPKGVQLSHHNIIAQLLTLRATNPFTHNIHMREAFFPSFSHIYGIVSGVMLPAWVGSYLQPMRRFEYLPYIRRCAELRAPVLRLVPAAAFRLATDPDIQKLDLKCVQTVMCSGAALSNETVESLKSVLSPQVAVLNGYGMSETTLTLLRETRKDKGASVGRPAAGVSIRVVDDDFNDVVPGTDGECLVQGPTVFMGYKNNPEETKSSVRDGWLMTGDVVRVDKEGFFYLTSRKKELIKFKGNQIPPTELEAVLQLHDSVAEAGVCGVWDKRLETEIAIGFVVLVDSVRKADETEALGDIKSFVNERVASYKRFREPLIAIEQLPKNTSGKLLRRHLTAKATELRSRAHKL